MFKNRKLCIKCLRRFIETTKSMKDRVFSALSNLENLVEDKSQHK